METKKKIFFLLYSMHVGGVEKSLASLLSIIPREEYDIHVGLVLPEGDLMSLLPSDVKVHHITELAERWQELKDPPLSTIKSYAIKGLYLKALYASVIYLACKLQRSYLWWIEYLLKDTKGISESFDVAVAYAGPSSDIDYYVCNKVKAVRKVGWVHFDISIFNIDKKATAKYYRQYDRIYVVSETGLNIFNHAFPEFQNKTKVFHNVVSTVQIKEQAKTGETYSDGYKGKRLLTVGRISPEKGQRVAIQALKLLVDKGYDIHWYFVGDGNDLQNCQDDIKKLGLTAYVTFLGTKTNPYAFMRDCDVYVQPSRHEGFCITLAEALCFDNPIVSTDFTGAREQLENRQNSVVVGMEAIDVSDGIEKALKMTL